MNKKIISFLSVVIMVSLTILALMPALTMAEIGDDIKDQLAPIEDAYGQSDVDESSLAETIAGIIKVVLSVLGLIFIILIIYAGFLWMTSAGNEDKIKQAKGIIVSSIIGVAIVLAAYMITVFVIDNLLQATGADY